jgi:hypothetical protein
MFSKDSHTVRSIIVDKVEVVGSKVYTTKGRINRDGKSGGAAASQRGVQVWCYSQGAGVSIVTLTSNGCPDNVDGIESAISWMCRLTEEVCGPFTGGIDPRTTD